MKQICQHCGKNAATVNYRETVGGKSRQLHLCTECAAKFGIVDLKDNLFSFSSLSSFPLFSSLQEEIPQAKKAPACPLCGTTLSQIQKNGKFGCSTCYDTFRDSLDLTPFVGKGYDAPQTKSDAAADLAPKNSLASLKAELKKAVAAEDYERAAKLRDEIRTKEGK